MKPPEQKQTEFEKVDTNDFVTGEIADIQYEQEHLFKGYNGAEDKKRPAVRLKFKVDGYKHQHYSRWMTFSYGDKSNLFLKYLVPLVEGAQPDMDLDLDVLKGVKVKMLWSEKNGFQSVETIRPIGKKISALKEIQIDDDLQPDDEFPEDLKEDTPF